MATAVGFVGVEMMGTPMACRCWPSGATAPQQGQAYGMN
jgi:3-hydroxyisobutyrate dehydrogenase-like beta-hydroxyacid dehydrogenase